MFHILISCYFASFALFTLFLTQLNLQPTVGPDGKIKEPESNVLLASIENMQYAVTVDVLHTVRIILCLFNIKDLFEGMLYNYNNAIISGVFCFWYCSKNCNV